MSIPKTKIYFYVPNLIGYLRLILLFSGIAIAREFPLIAYMLFILNLILDALDGLLARALNQTSRFGATLDYTIDRISFASYGIILGTLYPSYLLPLCFFICLDLSGHLFHLKAHSGKASHKEMNREEPFILRLYYKRVVLGISCLLHDLFFLSFFLYYFYPSNWTLALLLAGLPGVIFKTVVHLTKLIRASTHLLMLE